MQTNLQFWKSPLHKYKIKSRVVICILVLEIMQGKYFEFHLWRMFNLENERKSTISKPWHKNRLFPKMFNEMCSFYRILPLTIVRQTGRLILLLNLRVLRESHVLDQKLNTTWKKIPTTFSHWKKVTYANLLLTILPNSTNFRYLKRREKNQVLLTEKHLGIGWIFLETQCSVQLLAEALLERDERDGLLHVVQHG